MQYISELPAGDMVWVGGDFNSYSPVDSEPDSPTQPNYAGGAAQPEIVGWEPVAYLLDVGLEDGYRDLYPLELGYTKTTTDFFPWAAGPIERVDFLLHDSRTGWTAEEITVQTGGPAESGSDHYALLGRYTREPSADAGAAATSARTSMRITPNPATGRVAVHFELLQPQHLILDLIAPDGRCLRSLDAGYRNPGSHTIILDRGAPNLPAGSYYLRPRGTSTLRATPMRIL